MPRLPIYLAAVALPALLASCGDDLESRNAAVAGTAPQEGEMVITNARHDRTDPDAAPMDNGFADEVQDDEDEDLVFDAAPEDLIDTAQGFSAEPMDDAAGIDPHSGHRQDEGEE